MSVHTVRAGPAALWERARHAVKRETGLPCGEDTAKYAGLSKTFVTKITNTIGDQCASAGCVWRSRGASSGCARPARVAPLMRCPAAPAG